MSQKATNEKTDSTLDHNGQIPVKVELRTSTSISNLRMLRATIDVSRLKAANIIGEKGHFRQGLKLIANGRELQATPHFDGQTFVLEAPIDQDIKDVTVTLYDQPITSFKGQEDGSFAFDKSRSVERLTVSELRLLGSSEVQQPHIPTPRHLYKGFDAKKHAPITDLHTHSSAQLTADDLMDMGIRNHLSYPVELLEKKLGIVLTDEERAEIGYGRRFEFSPLMAQGLECEQPEGKDKPPIPVIPLEALNDEHKLILKSKFHVPQDGVLAISDFDEEMYRFTNPLVKNPAMTKEMLLTIAKNCEKNNIKYIELSTAAMLKPNGKGEAEWFAQMIEAVEEAKKEYGVDMRFLVGIPRTYAPHQILSELERIKYAMRHPYVVGIDLLGYEKESTNDFTWALSHIAEWARSSEGTDLKAEDGWDFRRDMVIRVHAGETGKANRNVAGAVEVAKRYGVRMRIAHAINEVEDSNLNLNLKKLSRPLTDEEIANGHPHAVTPNASLVSLEFCQDSNIAYTNILDMNGVPFGRWLEHCASWFLGTDGAGAMQTNPIQLALSALAGGMNLSHLEQLRKTEETFIGQQAERDALKSKAFHKTYGEDTKSANHAFLKGFEKHLAYVKKLGTPHPDDPARPILPPSFDGKIPILIGGASGSSWNDIKDPAVRKEIAQAMRMLVASVDPSKVYFVLGRTKSNSPDAEEVAGVTAALDEAVSQYNEGNPTKKFDVLSLNTEETTDIARSISWLVHQEGTRDRVPNNTMNYMRHAEKQGISIFIGGGGFTTAMIKMARETIDGVHETPYLLMNNAEGASMKMAAKSTPEKRFANGRDMIKGVAQIFQDRGVPPEELFREGVKPFDGIYLEELQHATKASFAQRAVERAVGRAPTYIGGK